jgi:hypothetical protein
VERMLVVVVLPADGVEPLDEAGRKRSSGLMPWERAPAQ